jgi:hypothetical protein
MSLRWNPVDNVMNSGDALSTIYQKQKDLAMNDENLPTHYIIEIKPDSSLPLARVRKKRGEKRL